MRNRLNRMGTRGRKSGAELAVLPSGDVRRTGFLQSPTREHSPPPAHLQPETKTSRSHSMSSAARTRLMPQRKPPAGEHQPYDVAENSKWSRAYILGAGIFGPRHRLFAKRGQRVGGDVECSPGTG